MSDKPLDCVGVHMTPLDPDMILYALRYCLSRRTQAVEICVEYLLKNWEHFTSPTRADIVTEIKVAMDGVGIPWDKRSQWNRVLKHAEDAP